MRSQQNQVNHTMPKFDDLVDAFCGNRGDVTYDDLVDAYRDLGPEDATIANKKTKSPKFMEPKQAAAKFASIMKPKPKAESEPASGSKAVKRKARTSAKKETVPKKQKAVVVEEPPTAEPEYVAYAFFGLGLEAASDTNYYLRQYLDPKSEVRRLWHANHEFCPELTEPIPQLHAAWVMPPPGASEEKRADIRRQLNNITRQVCEWQPHGQ